MVRTATFAATRTATTEDEVNDSIGQDLDENEFRLGLDDYCKNAGRTELGRWEVKDAEFTESHIRVRVRVDFKEHVTMFCCDFQHPEQRGCILEIEIRRKDGNASITGENLYAWSEDWD